MQKMKRDLILHYDEERGAVVCYSTDESNTRALREQEFGLEVAVTTYKSVSSDEAERMMGAGVFALLDLHSKVPIGVRDYRALSDSTSVESREQLEVAAQMGNAEAQYSLAMELFTDGVRHRSATQIDQAEMWLKKAADTGCADAVAYLADHWERSKASALRGMSKPSDDAA